MPEKKSEYNKRGPAVTSINSRSVRQWREWYERQMSLDRHLSTDGINVSVGTLHSMLAGAGASGSQTKPLDTFQTTSPKKAALPEPSADLSSMNDDPSIQLPDWFWVVVVLLGLLLPAAAFLGHTWDPTIPVLSYHHRVTWLLAACLLIGWLWLFGYLPKLLSALSWFDEQLSAGYGWITHLWNRLDALKTRVLRFPSIVLHSLFGTMLQISQSCYFELSQILLSIAAAINKLRRMKVIFPEQASVETQISPPVKTCRSITSQSTPTQGPSMQTQTLASWNSETDYLASLIKASGDKSPSVDSSTNTSGFIEPSTNFDSSQTQTDKNQTTSIGIQSSSSMKSKSVETIPSLHQPAQLAPIDVSTDVSEPIEAPLAVGQTSAQSTEQLSFVQLSHRLVSILAESRRRRKALEDS